MSHGEVVAGAWGRLLRSELSLVFGRRRNIALLVGLSLVPLLLGTVLFVTQDSALGGQGPGFVGRVTSNGLFLVVAALFMCLPFLLPLTTGIASGDAIAGEAQAGTLRYLLAVPVSRTRLLAVKAVETLAFVASAVGATGSDADGSTEASSVTVRPPVGAGPRSTTACRERT